MCQLGDQFHAAVADSSQVTGPVNQPTLFGSSIKAQNQWQRDEKEKFIQLLQLHGRNWQVIADELPRRTA
jgi:CHASE1-domain containing sensor protein